MWPYPLTLSPWSPGTARKNMHFDPGAAVRSRLTKVYACPPLACPQEVPLARYPLRMATTSTVTDPIRNGA
jgi:hypothetical protein